MQDDVEGPSTELRRQGVKTIGVGIGAGIDREEIAIIGGSESNTIVSESFEDIFNQLEAIRLETCRGEQLMLFKFPPPINACTCGKLKFLSVPLIMLVTAK